MHACLCAAIGGSRLLRLWRKLVTDRYRLGVVALRLADLSALYRRADEKGKRPVDILSADAAEHGGNALAVLRDALRALATGVAGAVPDLRWQASSTEITGLFDSVSLLADFRLRKAMSATSKRRLKRPPTKSNSVRDDLIAALTRAEPVPAAEQLALKSACSRQPPIWLDDRQLPTVGRQ